MSLKKTFLVKTLNLCLVFSVFTLTALAQSSKNLRVLVLEEKTKTPIVGAIVQVKKRGFVADTNGICYIPYDGSGKVVLSAKSIGYKPINLKSFSVRDKSLTVFLAPAVESLQGVDVTARYRTTSILQQTSVIDDKTLEKSSALSLAQLLENVPGVSSISSGNSISKPVIQGMHSSRILLLNNGVRLEGQNWGEDHAPEIDHTGSSVVEVIKGAESIRYGYGAVGGVVLFDQATLPYGEKSLKPKGKVNLGYSTNSRSYDTNATLDFGFNKFAARVHGMYQKAGDYSSANYLLNNTGYKNISYFGLLGYKTNKFTASVYSSLYYSRSGLYYGSNISDLAQLLARFERGRPEESTIRPFSYSIYPPMQQTQHFTIKGDAKWDISKLYTLSLNVSYQDNLRQEFENRKQSKYSWLPVQDLRLSTYNTELIFDAKWKNGMFSQLGFSHMYQSNFNKPGTKQPAFIPNFASMTTGLFLLSKATFGNLICSAGMRYDMRALDVNGYTSLASFSYYNDFKLYSNFTGNVAAHYTFTRELDARFNIGWAWRPPDINELYASGLHHGTYWVQGNRDLTSERGYKAVFGGRYHNSWFVIEPTCFYQHIINYIYDNIGTGANRFHNHPSGKYPKFVFGQDNVRLVGGDVVATVAPMESLSFTGKGEWIFARNLSQDCWLPFMPSDRYTLSGNYRSYFSANKKMYADFSLEGKYVTKQKRFDPEKDLVPDSPAAYCLLSGSLEFGWNLKDNQTLKFMLVGDNILNKEYKEYTDRFRYYAHARGAQFTIRTIFNF